MTNDLEQQVLAKARKWLEGDYDEATKEQVKCDLLCIHIPEKVDTPYDNGYDSRRTNRHHRCPTEPGTFFAVSYTHLTAHYINSKEMPCRSRCWDVHCFSIRREHRIGSPK